MKIKQKVKTHTILCSLLVLLGFGACDDPFSEVDNGTPSAKYKVRGNTIDKNTGEPVTGLRVVLYELRGQNIFEADTVHTDMNGGFDLSLEIYPVKELILNIEDIDGIENGLYDERNVKLDFTDVEYVDGFGKWYKGVASMDIGEVLMEEIKEV